MNKQSGDFINGYVFAHIESVYSKLIREDLSSIVGKVSIPKTWYGLKCSKSNSVSLTTSLMEFVIRKLIATFKEIAPHHNIEIEISPNEQYILFEYRISYSKKKLKLSEIEELLGYEVEIVDED